MSDPVYYRPTSIGNQFRSYVTLNSQGLGGQRSKGAETATCILYNKAGNDS